MVTASPWSPFRHSAFTVLWTATVISNIGNWMYVQRGMRMADDRSQSGPVHRIDGAGGNVAPNVPIRPARRALADIVDRRMFLVVAEIAITAASAVFAAIVWLGHATAENFLLFTFVIGVGGALTSPAWQAIVPQLVPKRDLHPAVAANSVGINVSRAGGPALAGIIVCTWGIAAPFWLNAISNLGIIGALMWWNAPQKGPRRLPVEQQRHSHRLSACKVQSAPARDADPRRRVLFASAYWALLPLVARVPTPHRGCVHHQYVGT